MKSLTTIRNQINAKIIATVVYSLPFVSNRTLVKLMDFFEKFLKVEDPIIKIIISEAKKAFQANHPCVELGRRILTELNSKSKMRFFNALFINSAITNASKRRAFLEEEKFFPPWLLVLSPTMRCNLNCVGCSTRRYEKSGDLPIPIIDRVLKEAKDMGIYFVVTQGGEMFVYEEMMDLYKKHKDIYFQVYTNGTLIDRQMSKRIAGLGNVAPMISIEGFKESTDARRGTGVFDKAMAAMDNLRSQGCLFGASVCQTRYNSAEILSDDFFEMMLVKGCYIAWFFQFLPVGKDPDLERMATPRQRHDLWKKVREIRDRLPLFIGDFWNDGPFVNGCISGGRNYFHINNKGDVEPCAFVHFAVDNIKNKSLREALNSDFFKFIRSRQPFSDGNLLSPCMIIDDPDVLRQAVAKTGARPTHDGADLILTGDISKGLDEYAREMRELTSPVWEVMRKSQPKWPT